MFIPVERIVHAMRRRRLLFFSMILGTLTLGIAIGTMINHSVKAAKSSSTSAVPISIPSPTLLSKQFSTIAKEIEHSVVNINTETIVKQQAPTRRRQFQGDPFEDFFERFFGPQGRGRPQKTRSLGSGFIVDSKGYILTNFHVVNKADKIQVKLSSGEEYVAKIVGEDQNTDLAVIKVDSKETLPSVILGDSDLMTQGDWVLAVGSPFGLEQTVTAGIISATGRIVNGSPWQRFLQTDAAINQGNSGGPLINVRGEVIGVNTAIITPTGGNLGIGFALPSNMARNVYNQIVQHGKVRRGAIGIRMQGNVKPQALKALGASDGKGVLVQQVKPEDGPAAKAGLKQGDVIVAINSEKISKMSDMHIVLSRIAPGTPITITYIRNGKTKSTQLVVGNREKIVQAPNTEATPREDGEQAIELGITVQNLTSRQARELNLLEGEKGVYVRSVKPESIADEAGLRRHDIIIEINKTPVTSTRDLREISSQLESGMNILFLVKRWEPTTEESIMLYLATTVP